MKITSVKFKESVISIYRLLTMKNKVEEYAFVGRSNVGKSSLINYLTNQKRIAKVSSLPGKTKYINFFLINNKWYFIDLPGYGYSYRKKGIKKNQKLMINYILYRKKITCLFLLIDCNVSIQKIDFFFIKIIMNKNVKFCVVFTKVDKLRSKKKVEESIFFCLNKLKNKKIKIHKYFVISAKNKFGKKNIIKYIEELNKINYKQKLSIPSS
ncbi:ribosome biogenesis GTP-binding protein YihA/YsxC [Blattabacterium cuenoti]|uniref:ribosome biogenesis GTP-binding protein YihA/YsxC n=1 Tax=Blattabacterium cuenoti TaxID=1653831 RepID=UPI00163C38C7|nr:ribosome biogenesis GTP-binding protein YihA/YsxC [Blattabacterium cuenoti]